jgi:nicotinamidase-related amidase
MREIVIPTTQALQNAFRAKGIDMIRARIACLLDGGRAQQRSSRSGPSRSCPAMRTEASSEKPPLSRASMSRESSGSSSPWPEKR